MITNTIQWEIWKVSKCCVIGSFSVPYRWQVSAIDFHYTYEL
jgi:hypothetical protein